MENLIEQILQETKYQKNLYFQTLHDGSFTKEDFVETQIQFYFAVVFFPRPMAAVAAKIPTHEKRLEIMRNVWEEHGDGDSSDFHGNTFIEFLNRIGKVGSEEIQKRKLWPEIRAFNSLLTGTCVMDEYIVGTALMGMIERMFSDISSIIGKGIVTRNWLKSEEMIHYNLHEKLDIKHSQDFFDVLSSAWEHSEEDRYLIEQGLRLGAYCFNNLYTSLYEARQKRQFADHRIYRHQRT